MPTITTAVRALKPGDVILEPLPSPVGGAASYVVLDLAIAEPGPVGVQLGRLGTIRAHLDRVATVSWPADTVLEVARPHRTPSQAMADDLLDVLADLNARGMRPGDSPEALLLLAREEAKPALAGTCPGCSRGADYCVCPDRPAVRQITREAAEQLAAGVPADVTRTLLRQADLLDQLFALHDVLDVAYVSDTLRVAGGLSPVHEGQTSELCSRLAARRQLAASLLADIERLAQRGQAARVTVVHDELIVEAVDYSTPPELVQ